MGLVGTMKSHLAQNVFLAGKLASWGKRCTATINHYTVRKMIYRE